MRAAEEIARQLLAEGVSKLAFEVADDDEALRVVADHFPGNQLPAVMAERRKMIDEETIRVDSVIRYLKRLTGLALAELERSP